MFKKIEENIAASAAAAAEAGKHLLQGFICGILRPSSRSLKRRGKMPLIQILGGLAIIILLLVLIKKAEKRKEENKFLLITLSRFVICQS